MLVNDRPGPSAGASGSHPDHERLAEYVDGVLAQDARQEVEEHLVTCEVCRELLAESVAATVGTPPVAAAIAPGPRLKKSIVLPLGLTAAAGLMLAVWVSSTRSDSLESAREGFFSAFANEPTRLVEGRLAGGFGYAPPPELTRGVSNRDLRPDTRIAIAQLERRATEDQGADGARALGLAALAAGDLDKAIQELLRAATLGVNGAADYANLSAAYLARGRIRGNAEDHGAGLAAAERALEIDSRMPEACFNRALALDYLSRTVEAASAWQSCADRSDDAQWLAEIRTHLPALP